jgi:hypothetical protein
LSPSGGKWYTHTLARGRIVGVLIAAVAAAVTLAPAASAGLAAEQFGISAGGGLHELSRADLNRELSGYKAAGAKWIRFDVDWAVIQERGRSRYDWAPFDAVVRAARLRGINVLGTISYTPSWARPPRTTDKRPPTNVADFGRFAAAAARRYAPLGVHHWQIWNEPNIDHFWKPAPDPAAYARLLRAAYTGIKRADPEGFVVTAGTAPSYTDGTNYAPVRFVQELYAAGGGPYFDALGHHASTFWAYPSEVYDWSPWWQMASASPSLRDVMVENGDRAKQIWVTEFSAPTASSRAVSEREQADMLTEAYNLWGTYPWAGQLFWFAYRDRRAIPTDWTDFCGLVRFNFTRKPAFYAYKALTSGPLY